LALPVISAAIRSAAIRSAAIRTRMIPKTGDNILAIGERTNPTTKTSGAQALKVGLYAKRGAPLRGSGG
jgi:hypothetical protein